MQLLKNFITTLFNSKNERLVYEETKATRDELPEGDYEPTGVILQISKEKQKLLKRAQQIPAKKARQKKEILDQIRKIDASKIEEAQSLIDKTIQALNKILGCNYELGSWENKECEFDPTDKCKKIEGRVDATWHKKEHPQKWYDAKIVAARDLKDFYDNGKFDQPTTKMLKTKIELIQSLSEQHSSKPEEIKESFEKGKKPELLFGPQGIYNILLAFQRVQNAKSTAPVDTFGEGQIKLTIGKHVDKEEFRNARLLDKPSDAKSCGSGGEVEPKGKSSDVTEELAKPAEAKDKTETEKELTKEELAEITTRKAGVLGVVTELGGKELDDPITIDGLKFESMNGNGALEQNDWLDDEDKYFRDAEYEGKTILFGIQVTYPFDIYVSTGEGDNYVKLGTNDKKALENWVIKVKEKIDKEAGVKPEAAPEKEDPRMKSANEIKQYAEKNFQGVFSKIEGPRTILEKEAFNYPVLEIQRGDEKLLVIVITSLIGGHPIGRFMVLNKGESFPKSPSREEFDQFLDSHDYKGTGSLNGFKEEVKDFLQQGTEPAPAKGEEREAGKAKEKAPDTLPEEVLTFSNELKAEVEKAGIKFSQSIDKDGKNTTLIIGGEEGKHIKIVISLDSPNYMTSLKFYKEKNQKDEVANDELMDVINASHTYFTSVNPPAAIIKIYQTYIVE